jgi:hypothetical protein
MSTGPVDTKSLPSFSSPRMRAVSLSMSTLVTWPARTFSRKSEYPIRWGPVRLMAGATSTAITATPTSTHTTGRGHPEPPEGRPGRPGLSFFGPRGADAWGLTPPMVRPTREDHVRGTACPVRWWPMERARLCARTACADPADAMLAFQYASKSVWLDDLGPSEPSEIDLCGRHADRFVPPLGWTVQDRRASSRPQVVPARVAS